MPYTEDYIKEKLTKELEATFCVRRCISVALREGVGYLPSLSLKAWQPNEQWSKWKRTETDTFRACRSFFQKVEDLSDGCGAKFNCIIVSSKFDGKPPLQRHRYEDEFPSTFRDLIMIQLKFTGVAMRSRKTEGNSSSYNKNPFVFKWIHRRLWISLTHTHTHTHTRVRKLSSCWIC